MQVKTDIRGALCVVAGGSQGIGLGVAEALAAQGARKVILLARRQGPLDEAAALIRARGAACATIAVDLGDAAAVARAAEQIRLADGVPDIIVYSAASGRFATLDECEPAELQLALGSTVVGAFCLFRAFFRELLERKRGHLVVVGSPVRSVSIPAIAYKASRHALHGFFEALEEDLRGTPIRLTYAEPSRISDSSYFGSNQGVEPRLPWLSRVPRSAPLWQTSGQAGEMIVRTIQRGRRYSAPLWMRLLTALSPRWLLDWSMRWFAVSPAEGGYPRR